nr:phosphopantetheine-binding protein [Acidomonas methanolica]
MVNTNSTAAAQTPFEHEMAERLIQALQLDILVDEIVPDAPLFGDGLGLDSIDALEIALLVSRDYGITLKSDDPDNKTIFASLRALSAHIQAHRKAA